MKRLLNWYGAVLMALLLSACSGQEGGAPSQPEQPDGGAAFIKSLQVTPAQRRIPVGLGQQFVATAFLSDGSSQVVTGAALSWSSSNASVATISATGLAAGIAPGTVTITASGTSNGTQFSATAQLTAISPPNVPPENRAATPSAPRSQAGRRARRGDSNEYTTPSIAWTVGGESGIPMS